MFVISPLIIVKRWCIHLKPVRIDGVIDHEAAEALLNVIDDVCCSRLDSAGFNRPGLTLISPH